MQIFFRASNLLHATHTALSKSGEKLESQEPRYHRMKARG